MELHISVLRAGTLPVSAFLQTIWPVMSDTCFLIAMS